MCLGDGGLVAFPTETVYGLGADATNGAAVARLYAAKGRPSFNPLIAHVFDLAAAKRLAMFDAAAEKLAAKFWPGPLTLVLKKLARCPVADLATAGLDSIAVRVPQHPVALAILTGSAGRWWRPPPIAPVTSRPPRRASASRHKYWEVLRMVANSNKQRLYSFAAIHHWMCNYPQDFSNFINYRFWRKRWGVWTFNGNWGSVGSIHRYSCSHVRIICLG